ncbi:Mu transposase C-terminal domain-containing protein [Pseudoduganella sp. RAF53_2]|uniref:Mu transposase C-terminal domain-containing protein n=1 Tax=unclassified Pseudoduganella TaxID=2637179 RepID=UPI003F9B8D23
MTNQLQWEFTMRPGVHFRHSTLANETVVIDYVAPQQVAVRELLSGDLHQIPRDVFLQLFSKGEIYPLAPEEAHRSVIAKRPPGAKDELPAVSGLIADKSKAEQEQGFKKLAYREDLLKEFDNLRPTEAIENAIEEIRIRRGDARAPSKWTIYRCDLAIKEAGGNVAVAFPNYADRGGPGKRRMDAITWDALSETLQKVRSSKGRILFSDVYDEVELKLIARVDDDAPKYRPAYSTVRRHTKAVVSALEMTKRNKGDKQAAREFDEWSRRNRAIAPLQRYECDDKNTGVFGVCERSGLPLGKIWLTVVLDQYSRMPVGHVVSGRAPNQWTALNALINAIMPKDMSSPLMCRVKSEVPYCGLPSRVIFDNALQNHARVIDAALVELCGIGTAYAKPYSPRHKPNIENYNGRAVKEFLADLPGFVGPKLSLDFRKEAKEKATATVEEFAKLYFAWVYNVYANKPGVDGYTPLQLWSEGMIGRQPRFPGDVFRMRLAAMPIKTRKLRPEHIVFHGLIYQHPGLQQMIKQGWLGHDIFLKYDPNDLGCIWFKDPLGKDVQWYRADSVNPEYTSGLTMYQHRAVRILAYRNKVNNPSRKQYVQFKAELKKEVMKLRWSPKMVERVEAQILTFDESSHPIMLSNPVQMGELEAVLHDRELEVAPEMDEHDLELALDLDEHMWSLDENV